jgi:hypothetical protein
VRDLVSDYCLSDHFLFLDSGVKEHAEELLVFFTGTAGDALSFEKIDAALKKMARLDLPLASRKMVPVLLEGFLSYLHDSGKLPGALQYAQYIAQTSKNYENGFRDDGSVRGETFTKKYTDVSRNDPCPCGSGKKFKKCCMSLIQ